MSGYKVTVRQTGQTVSRARFDALDPALDELERQGREIAAAPAGREVSPPLIRSFEPVQQVQARLELSGPGRLRAGVDVRGDGSSEAFTGRVRRRLVEARKGESPWDALRREVGA